MEAIVFGCVSALAGYCVFGLLPAGGAVPAAVPSPRDAVLDAVASCAADMGRMLGRLRLAKTEAVRRVADELREHAPRALLSRCARDEEGALGLLALLVLASGVVGLLISSSVFGMLVGCCAPVGVLASRSAMRARALAREVEGAMPEAFGALAIALGSGHSLSQAMRFVGAHAAEPIRSEFMRVSFSIDCGIAATEALDTMLARLPAPGLDLVALALKVSQRTGAPLRELLADASQLVGTRIELKRRLDVKTSQARMSARLVAGMPAAMIAVLALLSDDFRRGVAEPAGAVSIVLALALNLVAWSIISRIMKVRL